MAAETGATIWIELDDLIRYFDGSVTPTGIGRVQAEILPHLARSWPGRVAFCRAGDGGGTMEVLDFRDVRRLFEANAFLLSHRPDSLMFPVAKFWRYVGRRAAAAARALSASGRRARFVSAVRPGDVLLNLGASWSHRNFGRTVAELKRDHGMRFGLLVHDVLPASHPHFVSPRHVPNFNAWLEQMAAVWDFVLTPSNASAQALDAHMAERGYAPKPIRRIPFGTGFTASAPSATAAGRRHVLYVSTVEIRKNHILLFNVWERLVREHGPDRVPQLVFAGKYGWEIKDLLAALKETRFLDGKIRVVENLSDDELADLYARSLFTMFPSHCEGWGLPVAESLFFGRYCIASNATSIPEVGGPFVDYHDPTDADAAYRLVERALFEPDFLASRERHIRDHYRQRSWQETADAIVAAVDELAPSRPASASA